LPRIGEWSEMSATATTLPPFERLPRLAQQAVHELRKMGASGKERDAVLADFESLHADDSALVEAVCHYAMPEVEIS